MHPDGNKSEGFFVDVAEADRVLAFLKNYGVDKATHILSTHKHWDHTGGNKDMQKMFSGLQIVGGAVDDVAGCTKPVNEGDTVVVGSLPSIKCHHRPCHTKGHIIYYMNAGEPGALTVSQVGPYKVVSGLTQAVFTGDTVFNGGCGRFFEGGPAQMLAAMDLMQSLPDTCQMFCGHEYTLKNLEFCAQAEPDNAALHAYTKTCEELRSRDIPTVPNSLGVEKQINSFMRTRVPELQSLHGCTDATQLMHMLREWKNNGSKPKL